MVSSFQWELTLRQPSSGMNMDLHMGFIDAEHIEEFDAQVNAKHAAGWNEHECVFWAENAQIPRVFENNNRRYIRRDWHFYPKDGDRFRLDVDFARSGVDAYYNGDRIGVVTTSLPKSIYLIASAYWSNGTSFETTLFEEM